MDGFKGLDPILQALLAGGFTWGVTALGAALVFLMRTMDRRVLGQLSAVVEPIAAVVGAATVLLIRPALPYALAFAAGAMIYVVVEELIPESQQNGNDDLATLGTMVGFAVMMVLDVSLG